MEEKRCKNENPDEQKIEEILRKAGEQEEIPENLKPEQMKKFLEEHTGEKSQKSFKKWYRMAAAAASLVLVLFAGRAVWVIQNGAEKQNDSGIIKEESKQEAEQSVEENQKVTEDIPSEEVFDTSYDELYDFFQKREEEQQEFIERKQWASTKGDMENAETESAASDSATDMGQQSISQENGREEYADTNKQEEGVDEADIIKNDGRYLYQIIRNADYSRAIQIVDTQDGLKEVARIDGFDNIFELYVWKDKLVLFESCWAEEAAEEKSENKVCDDVAWLGTPFQKVYVYNIEDRENLEVEHIFTMKGDYLDSRVTEGYLYCFLTSNVNNLESRTEYENYVPVLEDKAMAASSIYLPEEAQSSSYVVMVSIDLNNPKELKDIKAIVSSADRVYVTGSNIYVADSVYSEKGEKEGTYSDKTNLFRFSYKNGVFRKEAEGTVKGILLDDMAINESDGYLRMAVTVHSYKKTKIIDDILGEVIGYETTNTTKDNSLYVLNQELELVGKIEGLAEEEQIYSARFMGDTGYFVTFRQVDPLFSVDLSDPENPKILGELKISGFSEYLHFYNENLLLGIGMEADEETGRTEGMKLSMFDVSNPADVKEQDKYNLSEYDYSEGLYNYKAVMIDTKKNLFGFMAEGWDEENKEDYLLFSYEDGAFQQKMKISCDRDAGGIYANVRGTYIGDVFYLMYEDGRVEAYSLADGGLLEKLSN